MPFLTVPPGMVVELVSDSVRCDHAVREMHQRAAEVTVIGRARLLLRDL